MILLVLGQQDAIRFNRLKNIIPNISQKMLTQHLRDMERDGLIKRKAYPEIPPRVEYSVTELGFSISSVYKEIHIWQQKNYKQIENCRKKYDQST